MNFYLITHLSDSLCVSINISKTYARKFCGEVKSGPGSNRLDFDGDPDSVVDPHFWDSLPLTDGDTLQCIAASYERTLGNFSVVVGRGPTKDQ